MQEDGNSKKPIECSVWLESNTRPFGFEFGLLRHTQFSLQVARCSRKKTPVFHVELKIAVSHHGRVVMLPEKKKKRCLPNHKCCGLGFYFPCYILFLTGKSPKSQSPHEVLAESPQSLHGVVEGL
jgi:hypothetical protein